MHLNEISNKRLNNNHSGDLVYDTNSAYVGIKSRESIDNNDTLKKRVTQLINKGREIKRIGLMNKIKEELLKENITPIYFKGVCLGKILYDDCFVRHVGDIDLFVEKDQTEKSIKAIKELGGKKLNKSEDTDHHISFFFQEENITVELHKSFVNPRVGLDSKMLVTDTMDICVEGFLFKTLGINSYLIYLLEHLYMHISDDINTKMIDLFFYNKMFDIENIVKPYKRNILELAALIERYAASLSQEKIEEFLNKTKLTRLHVYLINRLYEDVPSKCHNILDIIREHCLRSVEMTPNEDLIESIINNNTARIDCSSEIRKCISKNILKYNNTDPVCLDKNGKISWDVDEWGSIQNINSTYVLYGEKPNNSFDYSYNITIERTDHDLVFSFQVLDDKIIISDSRYFDPYGCDCVGIMCVSACSSGYIYRYIFTLLKKINDTVEAVPYDILSNNSESEIERCATINSALETNEHGYNITITIPFDYILCDKNDVVYIDIVGCDCDDKEKGRKSTLSLATNTYSFYDPRCFIKIKLT